MSYRCTCVVVQGVGGDMVLTGIHLDTIIERSLTCGSAISTPIGNKAVLAIYQLATLEEVGKVVYTVVIERISVQCLRAML